MKNKKILVTGGAGFIGSNLCEYFLKNNEIVCLDNFSTGKRENIQELLNNKNFTLVEGDIRNIERCNEAVKNAEIVFHQAALGSVPRSIKDPITTNQVNIDGFLNMLVASRDAGIKRFVYAASSSTYGDSTSLPKLEEKIGKPLSPYAITKYVNELYADVFQRLYGVETIGLRYFNVFGRRQDPDGAYAAVIPKFIKKMIQRENVEIYGNGTQSRDFTYIDNVIQANELAGATENNLALNTVYNVAFGERISLNQLVEYLREELSVFDKEISKVKPIYIDPRAGDIPHSLASIEKAKQLLNYNPLFSVRNGLKNAIDWYWNNLQ
ncbi:MAG: SDR family oxidoreductase [Bacteroidales bacterium]|nr:SDR family oxidoreductase [Bacteroidales bacterium]